MPIGLDLPSILTLIPSEGALLTPVFTPQGSAVFVIPHGTKEVTQEHFIQLDNFKEDELHSLLGGSEKETGWLWAYQNYYITRSLKNWQEAIASLTERLRSGDDAGRARGLVVFVLASQGVSPYASTAI